MTHWLIDSVPPTGTTDSAPAPVSDPMSGAGADPASGRRAATEPVELLFARDDGHDDMSAIHATLNLADRERDPRPPGTGDASEPPPGSIDFAVDAMGLTAAQLIAATAERVGLAGPATPTGPYGSGGPRGFDGKDRHAATDERDRVLARIAGDIPPIAAAFLSVDRTDPTTDSPLSLLSAVRAGGQTRLLLVFRDPASPLLEDVVDTLLDDDWAGRRTTAVAVRLERLAELEKVPPAVRTPRCPAHH